MPPPRGVEGRGTARRLDASDGRIASRGTPTWMNSWQEKLPDEERAEHPGERHDIGTEQFRSDRWQKALLGFPSHGPGFGVEAGKRVTAGVRVLGEALEQEPRG